MNKIRFVTDAAGKPVQVIRRVEPSMEPLFRRLQEIHCEQLPEIISIEKTDDALEVAEAYIAGKTLDQVLAEEGTFSDEALLAVAGDVCRALTALHAKNPPIVHRDIKPQNIMRREGGGYVLIDLDAARGYHEGATTDTRLLATVGYAAPEQYGLSQTDVRSDIFSLGVTLYELQTGEAFHMGAECGGALKRIVARCTAFDPKRRFQSVRMLSARLARVNNPKYRRIKRCAIAAAACVAVFCVCVSVNGIVKANTIPCTCDLNRVGVESAEGVVLSLENSDTASTQLVVTGVYNRSNCKSNKHLEPATVFDCKIKRMTLGGDAELTDDGKLTARAEGTYVIDAMVQYGEDTCGPVEIAVTAAKHPDAYEDCKCELDRNATRPVFRGDAQLPENGEPVTFEMALAPVYYSDLCTAEHHKQLMQFPGEVVEWPEGAECGVTEENCFHSTARGEYTLAMPLMYGLEEMQNRCLFIIH